MLKVLLCTKGIQAARIGRIAVVLLMATSSSGCATFSAVQPTTALVEPGSNTGSNASDEASADFATTPVDSQWITRVYRGYAGPGAGVAKM